MQDHVTWGPWAYVRPPDRGVGGLSTGSASGESHHNDCPPRRMISTCECLFSYNLQSAVQNVQISVCQPQLQRWCYVSVRASDIPQATEPTVCILRNRLYRIKRLGFSFIITATDRHNSCRCGGSDQLQWRSQRISLFIVNSSRCLAPQSNAFSNTSTAICYRTNEHKSDAQTPLVRSDVHVVQQLHTKSNKWNKQLIRSHRHIYTVSGKKVTPCLLSYNSGKWCRILTKFCINNATSNCKQTAKFQWNLSTTATVIVVLVRAPKKWSVHYRQRQRQLTVKLCLWRNSVQYDCLKFVRYVLRVLECRL